MTKFGEPGHNGGRRRGSLNRYPRLAREVFGPHVGKVVLETVRIALNSDGKNIERDTLRLAACRDVLDRFFGRAPQAVKVSGTVGTYDWARLSPEQTKMLYGLLIEAQPVNTIGNTD